MIRAAETISSILRGRVLRDARLEAGDIHINDAVIVEPSVGAVDGTVVDASGLVVAPGLIECQINGAYGHDFTENPQSIWAVGARLPEQGVTSFLPTIISAPPDVLNEARRVITAGPPTNYVGANPIGLHCEGPMLASSYRGTHRTEYLILPDPDLIRNWTPKGGVAMVTIAPELRGAIEIISSLQKSNVVVAIGHSSATPGQAQAAFDAGATFGTHLYNAMPEFEHRDPGLVGALLANPDIATSIIADGIHNDPLAVATAWRAKGPDSLILVTDAVAATCMPHGRYTIGDINVISDATGARNESGGLVGSLLTLDEAVRNLMAYTDCSIPEALGTVTTVPSRVLGLEGKGSISPGSVADLVLLDHHLEVVMTIISGAIAYRR